VATPFNFLTLTFNKKTCSKLPKRNQNFIKSTRFVRFKLDLSLRHVIVSLICVPAITW